MHSLTCDLCRLSELSERRFSHLYNDGVELHDCLSLLILSSYKPVTDRSVYMFQEEAFEQEPFCITVMTILWLVSNLGEK